MSADEKTNLITPAGYKKLSDEATHLWTVERPKVVDEVHQAALQGDRSENAEYIYGKKRLREIDRRVRFLQKRMDKAKIIDPTRQKYPHVAFGAIVKALDQDGVEKMFEIVGEDEIDTDRRQISWRSPIGRALLDKKVGDVIEVVTPRGQIELEILEVRYPEPKAT